MFDIDFSSTRNRDSWRIVPALRESWRHVNKQILLIQYDEFRRV